MDVPHGSPVEGLAGVLRQVDHRLPAVQPPVRERRDRAPWIGYNVLDWFMRDMTTKGLIIMADPNRPRHYEEEFKRRIVQS